MADSALAGYHHGQLHLPGPALQRGHQSLMFIVRPPTSPIVLVVATICPKLPILGLSEEQQASRSILFEHIPPLIQCGACLQISFFFTLLLEFEKFLILQLEITMETFLTEFSVRVIRFAYFTNHSSSSESGHQSVTNSP